MTCSDPPGEPLILGGSSHVVREGDMINVTCVSQGGNPPPQMSWYKENIKLQYPTVRQVLWGTMCPTNHFYPHLIASKQREFVYSVDQLIAQVLAFKMLKRQILNSKYFHYIPLTFLFLPPPQNFKLDVSILHYRGMRIFEIPTNQHRRLLERMQNHSVFWFISIYLVLQQCNTFSVSTFITNHS